MVVVVVVVVVVWVVFGSSVVDVLGRRVVVVVDGEAVLPKVVTITLFRSSSSKSIEPLLLGTKWDVTIVLFFC